MSIIGLVLGIRAEHNRNFKKHNVCVPTSHSLTGRGAYFKYAVETLGMPYRVGGACPNFTEKTFTDGTQTVKFVNVSPSKVSATIITYKLASVTRPSHTYMYNGCYTKFGAVQSAIHSMFKNFHIILYGSFSIIAEL